MEGKFYLAAASNVVILYTSHVSKNYDSRYWIKALLSVPDCFSKDQATENAFER